MRNHVRERKRQMGLVVRETFVPHKYSWGQEAQVDWYVCVLLAAALTEGPTTRVFKILLIVGVTLGAGAAMSHATGRALLLRGTLEPEEPVVKRS